MTTSNPIWDNLFPPSSPQTPKTPVLNLPNKLVPASPAPSMLSPPSSQKPVSSPVYHSPPAISPAKKSKKNDELLPCFPTIDDAGYKLIAEVGRGSFGTVWKAKQGKTEYALKTFNLKRTEAKNGFVRELAVQLFINNTTTKEMCDKSAVCDVSAFIVKNQTQTTGVIVYPFIVAGDMGQLIEALQMNKENKMQTDAQQYENLASQIDLGVDFLRNIATIHQNNIAHRDIKPENALIVKGKYQHSVFIDFGSACFYANNPTFEKQLELLLNEAKRKIGTFSQDFACIPIDTTLLYVDPVLAEMDELPDKNEDFKFGKQGDLFAAAVVLFELFLEQRAYSFVKSRNPIHLIKWKPDLAMLSNKSTENPLLRKYYRLLSIFLENLLSENDSADVYAEQLHGIGQRFRDEIKK